MRRQEGHWQVSESARFQEPLFSSEQLACHPTGGELPTNVLLPAAGPSKPHRPGAKINDGLEVNYPTDTRLGVGVGRQC